MAFSEDLDRPGRCRGITKFGVRCKCPVTRFDSSYCIFHSKVQALVPIMQEGRVKGGSRPEGVRTLKKRVDFLGNSKDLVHFVNRWANKKFRGEIDSELYDDGLKAVAVLLRIFEQVDIGEGLDRLEMKLESLLEKARLKSLNLGRDEGTDE